MSDEWKISVFQGARQNSSSGPITPGGVSISQSQIDQYTAWNQNVAGKDELAAGSTPVAGSAINGTVNTNSVAIAPATAVAVKDTNLLVSQDFASPTSMVSTENWSWYGDDGHLRPGCARVDCNGIQDDLVSNEVLVVKGENITITVWVKWSGLVYSGSDPISLGVEKYRKGRDPDSGGTVYLDLGGANIAALASPASSGGWTKLTGTYTVPAKVDQLRFRFRSTATDGYVLWDEAVFMKTDLIGDDAVPGVGKTVDNVVTKLYGGTGTGYTHDDEAVALENTAQALTTNSAKVSQIEATTSTGTIAGDDFSYTATIIGHGWGGSNAQGPYYSADGNNAIYNLVNPASVNTALSCKHDWQGTGATSSTDYQKIQLVLSRGIDSYGAGYATMSVFGRISSDWTSYIELVITGSGTYQLNCCVSGGITTMTSGSCSVPGVGGTITLYCGDKATTAPRKFKAEVNGSTILNYTDASTSNYGALYRKWGWGGAGVLTYVAFGGYRWIQPGEVNQWTGVDQ